MTLVSACVHSLNLKTHGHKMDTELDNFIESEMPVLHVLENFCPPQKKSEKTHLVCEGI